jgi:hypothetical protein
MKINKWTLGLAAVGLVSLAPAVMAQTAAAPAAAPATPSLMTALSATTISGYVDTSAVWNPGTGNANPAPYSFNAGKQDGFNIDDVDIKLSKPFDSGKWSAGYVAELNYGPDATAIDGGAAPIRQAYLDLEIPVGNGIELKLGRWDNILGYEVNDSMNDPNWTRSYGYSFEPTEHTGGLANYQFASWISAEVGYANELSTVGFGPNAVNARPESRRAFVSLLTLTAPDSWGFLKGSALYGGLDYGPGAFGNPNPLSGGVASPGGIASGNTTEWYVGATINTPINNLSVGASFDSISDADVAGIDAGYFYSVAGYATYKINDKCNIDGRVEWADGKSLGIAQGLDNGSAPTPLDKVVALTGTFEYDLWANVMSRLEVRWDHDAGGGGPAFGGETTGAPTKLNEVLIAANLIYKF